MRTRTTIVAATVGTLLLTGCQQRGEGPGEPEPSTEPAQAPADAEDEPMDGYACQ